MKISYSAPAKVILSGEHSVVYGKPALVSAFDLRMTCTVKKNNSGNKDKTEVFITETVKNYLKRQKIDFIEDELSYEIHSNIPIGRGLGSSAALAVVTSACLLESYTGREFDIETINNVAYQIEKYFHKNSSGVDVSASSYGGLIYYRKEFEFLKNISSLNFKIPKKFENNLFLIDTGKPKETTGEMVNLVGQFFNSKSTFIEEVLNDIEKTTKRMVVSIIKEDVNFFQKTIIDNQILLEMLGVVSKKTKEILKQLEQYGVGKVTGAGGIKSGSGFILFYSTKNKDLINYLKRKKINFYHFKQDFKGLQR